ncbi:hypothetical protein DAPPUDRAFT_114670 [Daphnia pulex]|uniref:Uncharacterized protein n=1 Tax=Daphnia pulex TaxID=6669 RepID=E9HIX6_DAPPU|nr:hypothetical protein DAPPUDRAFT_114670 [Daphnia pulex]|eukprot:EFX68314.1 hypothetical protein DAPPUDRAFT_114670 [Daphnia pulex]
MQTEYTNRYPPLHDLRVPDHTDRYPPLDDPRAPDHTDEYPLFEDTRALKQARSTEKARATKLGKKIIKHARSKGSRTEMKFMRTEYSAIIADCLSLQQQYCDSKEEQDERDNEWTKDLGDNAKEIFEVIELYLASSSRPPSAVSIGHASHRSLGIQSNAIVFPDQPDPPNRSADHHSISPSSSVSNQAAKALEEERRQREQERRLREQLEKQIQQMKIDEKAKIKKAVEEERDRQASKYTTANREAVNEAEKRANEIADENKKIRTALEVEKKKAKGAV